MSSSSSSFLEKHPDFVLKLKIKAADGQTQIRRVRLPRIADGDGNVSYEELVGLVVVFSIPEAPAADSDRYNVSLTYYDVDGDSITIASSEELVDACEQYVGQKVLRITTYVKPKTTTQCQPIVDGTSEKKSPPPSVDRGTSSSNSPPIQIQDVLESFVGILSTAVNHLQEGLVAKSSRSSTRSAAAAAPAAEPLDTSEEKASAAETSDKMLDEKLADKSLEESKDTNQEEDSAEDQKIAADPPTDEETEESSRPFIHGRHTCDSCLSTPIIGTRYHSTNLKDYDLCENCYGNYKGKEIVFEPAELERDRLAQERWHRRLDNCRGLRRGRFGRGIGPRGQRFGRPGRPGRFAGPHAPPPPYHMATPPPPGCPPPPPGCPPPPHRPFGPPNMYPGVFNHAHWAHLGPHVAPHIHCPADGIAKDFDSALKEAIRRSLNDIAPKEAKINEQMDASSKPSAPVEESAVTPVAVVETQNETPIVETVNDDEDSEVEAAGIPRSVEIVVDDSSRTEDSEDECTDEAKAMEKSMHETESVDSEKLASEAHIAVATPSPSKSSSSSRKVSDWSKDESFASDAKGNGDIAEAMGAALDAVVDVIREMQAESADDATHQTEDNDDISSKNEELILDSTELLLQADNKDDDSEWSVVKSVGSNGTTESEQIAKAAEMLGSALYNSDMKTSSDNNNADVCSSGSTFSIPSSVPTDIGTHHMSAAAPAQLDRWVVHLLQLKELGFDNEAECVEVLERLEAANIGVDADEDLSFNHVVNELLEKKK